MHRPKCLLELQRAAYPTNAPWKFRVKLLNPNWSDRNCLFEGFSFEICVSWWLMYGILLTSRDRFNESFSYWIILGLYVWISQTCSLTNWHCLTSLKYEGGNWQFQESCDTRYGTTKRWVFSHVKQHHEVDRFSTYEGRLSQLCGARSLWRPISLALKVMCRFSN